MRLLKKILKVLFLSILALALSVAALVAYCYFSADMGEPTTAIPESQLAVIDKNGYKQYGDNLMRRSESGLYELKITGNPLERGLATGILAKELLYFQEKVFVAQIKKMIPSENYLKFLHFFILLFNRHLGEYVPLEYREEIYGIAHSCTREFDDIGTPYERQLNYHAAHDIGHALSDLMLVGCSSFAVWDEASSDSTLTIGRNFDFYMGDDFAKNKTVSFCEPESGYKFASVGWAGMIGVLSGMNEKGLTVTINASKSAIPTSAATPISILTREILQYASTIGEACDIALKHRTFVSESILIGSAGENKAMIIEKSPTRTALFETDGNRIICTNHFQSDTFKDSKRNIENIQTSDSRYRHHRLAELLNENIPLDETKAASVLRNRFGSHNEALGLGNEMAVNQFIAHHSVIFKPAQLQMWVSTAPWQSGKYVAYNLNKIFSDGIDFSTEIYDKQLEIPADTFLFTDDYQQLLNYRRLQSYFKHQLKSGDRIPHDTIEKLERSNPEYYHMYEMIGDYYLSVNDRTTAAAYWTKALGKKIPRKSDETRILNKLEAKQ
jgi:hypothetical protein